MKPTITTWILTCGLLVAVAGVGCGRDLPGSALTVVSSLAQTTIVECDVALPGELKGSGDRTVRFVAYGNAYTDNRVGCGMLPNVRMAVIYYDAIGGWWELIGDDLGIFRQAPPGLLIPSSGERFPVGLASFVTTGPDGIAESAAGIRKIGMICAMSPIKENLIAGCSHETIQFEDEAVVYVYFTHGHAIVETGPHGAERYQRFLNGADISDQSRGTVYLISIISNDYGPESFFLAPETQIAIIEDAYVNAWWSEAPDDENLALDMSRRWSIHFNPEVLENKWVHVIATGDAGVAKITLPPGDYLFCGIGMSSTLALMKGCDHEDILSSRDHVIEIDVSSGNAGFPGVRMLTDNRGKQLLRKARTAPIY